MRLLLRFVLLFVGIPLSSAQANQVGLTTEFIEAGAIFEGRSPETADMVCSGVLVGCDKVLTAAHCLEYRHVAENRFWFYLPYLGPNEVHPDGFELFCDSVPCADELSSPPDLALLRLRTPVWKPEEFWRAEDLEEERDVAGRFVGYGIRLPRLDNYNLKRMTTIRIDDCDTPHGDAPALCSDLDDELPVPCHKDSGGPLYAVAEKGGYSLLGIATRTGLGCRSGQAEYLDTTNPVIQTWLSEQIDQSADRCNRKILETTEFVYEPEGWLDGMSQFQELEIEVTHDLDELLVTLNHAPGASTGDTHNDFDLELADPDNDSASLLPYCDNTWKLLAVCRVPSPVSGTWKARIIRRNGEGHFQLVATGIKK